jgi:hypothetical protein
VLPPAAAVLDCAGPHAATARPLTSTIPAIGAYLISLTPYKTPLPQLRLYSILLARNARAT